MKGQIRNMQTTARQIYANRAANSAASKKFAVRSLTKAGKASKATDHPMNLVSSLEAAETRKVALESMNPGKQFVVVEL